MTNQAEIGKATKTKEKMIAEKKGMPLRRGLGYPMTNICTIAVLSACLILLNSQQEALGGCQGMFVVGGFSQKFPAPHLSLS